MPSDPEEDLISADWPSLDEAAFMNELRQVQTPTAEGTVDPSMMMLSGPYNPSMPIPSLGYPASAPDFEGTTTSLSIPYTGNTRGTATMSMSHRGETDISYTIRLPATMELVIKGLKLRQHLKDSQLQWHWLEIIPPHLRSWHIGRQLTSSNLVAPAHSLPDAFMALICERYRNAIMDRINDNPLNQTLIGKLASFGTSLHSLNLCPSRGINPTLDTVELEEILKPYFDQPPSSVVVSKVAVDGHGILQWTLTSAPS